MILSFCLVACSSYQKVGVKDSYELNKRDEALIELHSSASRRIMFEAYRDYVILSSMVDTSGPTSETALFDFKLLFESNAKIYNDLQLEPDNIIVNADTYAGIVSSYLYRNGVIVEFDEPDINYFFSANKEQFQPRVDKSEADDFIFYYSYRTEKRNYNILNKNNQELMYDEPMIYPLEITFRISIKNQQADIVSILLDKSK